MKYVYPLSLETQGVWTLGREGSSESVFGRGGGVWGAGWGDLGGGRVWSQSEDRLGLGWTAAWGRWVSQGSDSWVQRPPSPPFPPRAAPRL